MSKSNQIFNSFLANLEELIANPQQESSITYEQSPAGVSEDVLEDFYTGPYSETHRPPQLISHRRVGRPSQVEIEEEKMMEEQLRLQQIEEFEEKVKSKRTESQQEREATRPKETIATKSKIFHNVKQLIAENPQKLGKIPIKKWNEKGSTVLYWTELYNYLLKYLIQSSSGMNLENNLSDERKEDLNNHIEQISNLIKNGHNGQSIIFDDLDRKGTVFTLALIKNLPYPDGINKFLKLIITKLKPDGSTTKVTKVVNNYMLNDLYTYFEIGARGEYKEEEYQSFLRDLWHTPEIEFVLLKKSAYKNIKQRKTAGFFLYNHKLRDIDLSKLQIYHKDNIEKDIGEINCFLNCLKQCGITEENKIATAASYINNGVLNRNNLEEIAQKLDLKIELQFELNGAKDKSRKQIFNKKGKTEIKIGLINKHYFPIIPIEISRFAIKNYEEIQDVPTWWKLTERYKDRKTGSVRWRSKSRDAKPISSFEVVRYLLEYKDKLLEPITTENLMKYSIKDYKSDHIEPQKDPTIEIIYKKREKEYSGIYAFDTEACPFGKHTDFCGSLGEWDLVKGEIKNIKSRSGPDYFERLFSQLPPNKIVKKIVGIQPKHFKNENTLASAQLKGYKLTKPEWKDVPLPHLILVHNLKYDLSFIKDKLTGEFDLIEHAGKVLTIKGYINGRLVEFRDSYSMISTSLKKFGEMFYLDQEKEVFPYELYTKDTIKQRNISIEKALKYITDKDKQEQFIHNIDKLQLRSQHNQNKFNHLKYAEYYCKKDVEVLLKGYFKFRKWIDEVTGLDILQYLTIPSLSHDYFKKEGCYEGCYDLTGITREYIQKAVVGGRCQLRYNKPQHIESKLYPKNQDEDFRISEEEVDKFSDEMIQDFDACSLYPSAIEQIGKLGGYLKGTPKPFKNDTIELKHTEYINNNINDYNPRNQPNQFNKKEVEIYERVDVEQLSFLVKYQKYLQEYLELNKPKNKKVSIGQEVWKLCNHNSSVEQLIKYSKLVNKDGYVKVKYRRSKHIQNVALKGGNPNVGRLYTDNGLSLQGIKRKFRQLLGNKYYMDVDMVNAHPTIFLGICENVLNIDMPYLREYVNNREQIIKEIIDLNPGYDREDIKNIFLVLLNGGTKSFKELPNKTNFLIEFEKEVDDMMNDMKYEIDYTKYVNRAKQSPVGVYKRATNILITDFEDSILELMYQFFKKKFQQKHKNEIFTASLQFDGLNVPKMDNTDQLIEECEKLILKIFKIPIKLKIKEFDDIFDINDFKEYVKKHEGKQQQQYDYNFLSQQDGYFVKIVLKKMGIKRSFPVISKVYNNKRNWENNLTGEFIVDKITLEDLIEFNGLDPNKDIEILHGYYFNEGRNDKVLEVIRHLYNERKIKKQQKNPVQEIYKLIMNAAYGKTIMKPIEKKITIVQNQEELNRKIISSNNNFIEAIPIGETGRYRIITSQATYNHQSTPQVGAEILSMSKRLMNQVQQTAEDIGINIYYQDTDSMHILGKDVKKLQPVFKEKYGRELIGGNMGNFHSDFSDLKINGKKYPALGSVKFIGCAKKLYYDLVAYNVEGKIVYKPHFKTKGIKGEVVELRCKELGITIEHMFENLLKGHKYSFDMAAYQDKGICCFEFTKDGTVYTKQEFIRTISITV